MIESQKEDSGILILSTHEYAKLTLIYIDNSKFEKRYINLSDRGEKHRIVLRLKEHTLQI